MNRISLNNWIPDKKETRYIALVSQIASVPIFALQVFLVINTNPDTGLVILLPYIVAVMLVPIVFAPHTARHWFESRVWKRLDEFEKHLVFEGCRKTMATAQWLAFMPITAVFALGWLMPTGMAPTQSIVAAGVALAFGILLLLLLLPEMYLTIKLPLRARD